MKSSKKNISALLFMVLFTLIYKLPAQDIEQPQKQFINKVNEINNSWKKQIFKSKDDSAILLDSIIEFKNVGYFSEYYKCYYEYNFGGDLLQNKRYTYNSVNQWRKITEITKFNKAELPSYYSITMPTYISNPNTTDETIFEQKNINYTYNNFNDLIEYEESYWEYGDQLFYNTSYVRDSNSKIHKKINKNKYADGYVYTDSIEYFYNDAGQLIYELRRNRYVKKYSYIKTDSTLTTIYNYAYLDGTQNWAEINIWEQTMVAVEKFNTQNLLVQYSLAATGYYPNNYDYYATFSYNDNNQLLHASYYKPNDIINGEEQMHLDYTYDEQGNTTLYEMTFYDDNFNSWQLMEQKNYYYSLHTVGISNDKEPPLSIYPNPASNFLHINTPNKNGRFFITTIDGKVKMQGIFNNNAIDISQLKTGLYLFITEVNEQKVIEKLFKNQ